MPHNQLDIDDKDKKLFVQLLLIISLQHTGCTMATTLILFVLENECVLT